MSGGNSAVEEQEKIRARRALLTTPLMGPENQNFPVVTKHSRALITDMNRALGYQLKIKRGVARLKKIPTPGCENRPLKIPVAKEKHQDRWRPFTRNHYILLCLTLAALDRGGSQATIEWVAQRIISRSREADLRINFDKRDHRVALGEVIAYLEHMKILEAVDVNTQEWIKNSAGDSSLYNVNRTLASEMISAPKIIGCRNSEEIDQASNKDQSLSKEPSTEIRQAVSRRLAEEPVVYLNKLSEEEREYYRGRQRAAIDQEIALMLGLKIERYKEGTALVDRTFNPEKAMSDLRLPHRSRSRQMAVLLSEYIKTESKDGQIGIERQSLENQCAKLIEEHFELKTDKENKTRQTLDQALETLREMQMVSQEGQETKALPLITLITNPKIETKDTEESKNV